jgi:hypothetical protein
MRIWSFHPRYLDAKGLVALWREALLAQAVLRGSTRGYRHHPQLVRFLEQQSPLGSIASYLIVIHDEAIGRGYRFAKDRISRRRASTRLTVTTGQLEFEWRHFMHKARSRAPRLHAELQTVRRPDPHPLFRIVRGSVAAWEKGERGSVTEDHAAIDSGSALPAQPSTG